MKWEVENLERAVKALVSAGLQERAIADRREKELHVLSVAFMLSMLKSGTTPYEISWREGRQALAAKGLRSWMEANIAVQPSLQATIDALTQYTGIPIGALDPIDQ